MTQDGLTNLGLGEDVLYTGYPIVFTVQGGGLDVADDVFYLTANLGASGTAACRNGRGQIADATLVASRSFSISPSHLTLRFVKLLTPNAFHSPLMSPAARVVESLHNDNCCAAGANAVKCVGLVVLR